MSAEIEDPQLQSQLVNGVDHGDACRPGATVIGKQRIGDPLPPLLLLPLQGCTAVGSQRDEPVLEPFSLVNVQFPDASNLDDIRGF